MGYTHYYQPNKSVIRELEDPQETWNSLLRDCEKIITHPLVTDSIDLTRQFDSETQFAFNGAEEEGGETFVLNRDIGLVCTGPGEWFCKTYRRPYNTAVVACLAVLADSLLFDVSSDGTADEWDLGVRVACEVLGRPIPNPLREAIDVTIDPPPLLN